MQQRIFAPIFLGMAIICLCMSPRALSGQSAPPGQVTHRMASAPPSAKDTVRPVRSLKELTTVKKAATPPAEALAKKSPELSTSVAPTTTDPCDNEEAYTPEMDQCQATNAVGSAKLAAWQAVVALDNAIPKGPDVTLLAARNLAMQFEDSTDLPAVELLVSRQELEIKDGKNSEAMKGVDTIRKAMKGIRCWVNVNADGSGTGAKPQLNYGYRVLFPTFGGTCSANKTTLVDPVKNYFNAGTGSFQAANQVKYLYNAQQSSSQFTADMLTSKFSFFQAILAGTATAGSGQPATASSGTATAAARLRPFATSATTTSTPTTDSIATAVARIQNGGDFNVRFPMPLLYYTRGNFSINSDTHPNVGFNIDKFSGQSTITGSTEYTFNVPLETYIQLLSSDTDTNGIATAALFLDFQPSAQIVSSKLANEIGLTGSRAFFLGQAAGGIQFSNSIGISFQYFYGPKQAYSTTDSTGATTLTNPRIQGFHLAVSFSPQKKSR